VFPSIGTAIARTVVGFSENRMSSSEVVSILNGLIRTCKGGEERYRTAVETLSNAEFRRLFNTLLQQRRQFISELQAEIYRLEGNLRPDASAESPDCVDMPDAEAEGDEPAVVSECERGEELAVNNYREALKTSLPLDVEYVVKRQYMDIKDAYDRIRILQHAA
jgi:uncharacterized protein (TIGR02284 family)